MTIDDATAGTLREAGEWPVKPGARLEAGPFGTPLFQGRELDEGHYYHNPTTVRLGLDFKIPIGRPFTVPWIESKAKWFGRITPFFGGTGFANQFTRPDGKEGESKISWTPLGAGLGFGGGIELKHWSFDTGVAVFLQGLASPTGDSKPYNRPPADKCRELLDPISCQTTERVDTSKGAYSRTTHAAVNPGGGNIFTFAPFIEAAYRWHLGKGWTANPGLRVYFPHHEATPKVGGGGGWWAVEPVLFFEINMGDGQVTTPAPAPASTPAPTTAPVPAPAPAPAPALAPTPVLPAATLPSTAVASFKEVVLAPRAGIYLNDPLSVSVVLKEPAPDQTDVEITVVEKKGATDSEKIKISAQIQKGETEVRDVSIWKAGEAADKVGTGTRTIKIKIGDQKPITGPSFTVWKKWK